VVLPSGVAGGVVWSAVGIGLATGLLFFIFWKMVVVCMPWLMASPSPTLLTRPSSSVHHLSSLCHRVPRITHGESGRLVPNK
jgi:hypothetical protein